MATAPVAFPPRRSRLDQPPFPASHTLPEAAPSPPGAPSRRAVSAGRTVPPGGFCRAHRPAARSPLAAPSSPVAASRAVPGSGAIWDGFPVLRRDRVRFARPRPILISVDCIIQMVGSYVPIIWNHTEAARGWGASVEATSLASSVRERMPRRV
ncbi:hypothetical protein GCM10010171_26610 [Actinokineospora fastidiosa]|uniref:Uncharacterized protein n=1 Tax=Actinokineospora fastidiosa TaxID=1816 RepID=A0A918LD85_9PSEU|nr:hypothetical protein GCM10010171_26610 [Actinokineospora fastidiosa]